LFWPGARADCGRKPCWRAGSFWGRLHRRIDEIATVILDPIAAQSAFRLDKFEQAVGMKPVDLSPEQPYGPNYPGSARDHPNNDSAD